MATSNSTSIKDMFSSAAAKMQLHRHATRWKLMFILLTLLVLPKGFRRLALARKTQTEAKIIAINLALLPVVECLRMYNLGMQLWHRFRFWIAGTGLSARVVDETAFPSTDFFAEQLRELEARPLRAPGSKQHEQYLDFLLDQLQSIPNLQIEQKPFDFTEWKTVEGTSLSESGSLLIIRNDSKQTSVRIAGVVPNCKPSDGISGPLLYVPKTVRIDQVDVKGKIVIRDFPSKSIPNALAMLAAYAVTADVKDDVLSAYDRLCTIDVPLSEDIRAAARRGASGLIIAFDHPRDQILDYWDPHQGMHYSVPAVFVGVDERETLLAAASKQLRAEISLRATISTGMTRNIIATLPGRSEEFVVYATHTDGTTCVQENGPIALLALARHFAHVPLEHRHRTIKFAFNSTHLHVSREGSGLHALDLDRDVLEGKSKLALVIPVEHLGTREVISMKRPRNQIGRQLQFTGRSELMIWCVGPSTPVLLAVCDAVKRRSLDRVLVSRGTSLPNFQQVPSFQSFGGLGTLYHSFLLPTTSLISGPSSLWTPCFGASAVDARRMRMQALALGDVYFALETVSQSGIEGSYATYRRRRAQGFKAPGFPFPREEAGLFRANGDEMSTEEYRLSV